ncbi:MAG: ATP-binding protein [candidate division Zixibacteria bacterium]|nr:ATP-binding protein [candidate division Zixibacteria bacterium]
MSELSRKKKALPVRTTAKSTATKPAKETTIKAVATLEKELEEKVRLLSDTNRQLKRKIFDLYTVFEISRNINSVLEYQTLLDSFIFTCLGQVGVAKGAIFLSREGHKDKFFLAKAKGSGEFPDTDEHFVTSSRLTDYLTRLNRPILVDELTGELVTPSEHSILSRFPSGVIVPLIYKSKLSGIFAMADKISSGVFSTDDLEFLSVLANQIAVAIENALLFEGVNTATRLLRETQHQLLQTEKLAALGEMSARVAHEVNNPLGIIQNYVLLMRRTNERNAQAQMYADIISGEIDRIARIVRQLLQMHRPEATQFMTLNLTAEVDTILNLMERPLAMGLIETIRAYNAQPVYIKGDSEQLKQVFLNLIINARDAMPDSGKLTVGIESGEDNITLSFQDTGTGIPPELVPRIFEPFFTTKEASKGTGLGLSVCYGIIKNHNGSITFSNMNFGGRIDIVLPRVKE